MEEWKRVSTTAHRLKEALDLRNMKQSDLSRITGLDKGSIHHYLTGKYEPKSRAIQKMASALSVQEMWLWGYDVPMEKEDKKISFDEGQLTEGKKLILELFDKISEEDQIKAAQAIKAFMQLPDDYQKLVNQMVQAAVNNQK